MKKILLTSVLIIAVAAIFATSPLASSRSQINAGFGFSGWGVPVYLGLDLGLGRDVTIGGEVSFRSYREDYHGDRWNHSVIGISGNLNYHFTHLLNIATVWDPYAGINVGYYIVDLPDNYPGSYKSQLGLGGQFGIRYYITNSVGVNLEFGGGNAFSGGKLGLSFKL